MAPGGLSGLQIREGAVRPVLGGFDSHTPPPFDSLHSLMAFSQEEESNVLSVVEGLEGATACGFAAYLR